MKVTRRGLARLAVRASAAASVVAAIPEKTVAQALPPPPVRVIGRSATALAMDKVKLPRATEPAMRFEA